MTDTKNQKPRPTWLSGRRPILVSGSIVVLCGAAGAMLTEGAREMGDLSRADPGITSAVLTTRSSLVNWIALGVTLIGSTVGLLSLTLVVALWLGLHQRRWDRAGLFVVAMVGAASLTVAIKTFVGRARPPISDLISAPSNDPSFPSGHTLNSTVLFGLFALAVLCERYDRGVARSHWWVYGLCIITPLAVGYSRVYLAYHWATDVMAGWVLGVGYVALVVLLGCLWDRRRRGRRWEAT